MSTEYSVNEEGKYIFTRTDIDEDTIIPKLEKDPEVTLEVSSVNNGGEYDNTNNTFNNWKDYL